MAEFFIYSECGDGAFLARRLISEGHRTRLYVKDPKAKNVYRGLVALAASPNPSTREICIFDMVKYGAYADQLRRRGHKVIGASRFADQIEIDRTYGSQVMKDIGIKIPETVSFNKLEQGMKFLDTAKGHWFYKPSGNMATASTFNGEPRDLKRYLSWTKHAPPDKFELQKKMEGTEISLEGWFDGRKWVYPFNSTVEDKKFMAGDIGPRTGCMANVVWAYDEPRPLLAVKTLMRIAPLLEHYGYVGPVDINLILDKEGCPYGLEWSPRFGYDALYALCMLTEGNFGNQLYDFAYGKLDAFSVRTDAYGLTLNISVPPYPTGDARDFTGLPLDDEIIKSPRIFPRDVMLQADGPALAGSDGSVCVVGAVGTDIDLLRGEVVDKSRALKVPNAQFRIDPVKRLESVLTALSSFNYEGPTLRAVDEEIRDLLPPEEPVAREPARATPGINSRPTVTQPAPTVINYDQPTFNE